MSRRLVPGALASSEAYRQAHLRSSLAGALLVQEPQPSELPAVFRWGVPLAWDMLPQTSYMVGTQQALSSAYRVPRRGYGRLMLRFSQAISASNPQQSCSNSSNVGCRCQSPYVGCTTSGSAAGGDDRKLRNMQNAAITSHLCATVCTHEGLQSRLELRVQAVQVANVRLVLRDVGAPVDCSCELRMYVCRQLPLTMLQTSVRL